MKNMNTQQQAFHWLKWTIMMGIMLLASCGSIDSNDINIFSSDNADEFKADVFGDFTWLRSENGTGDPSTEPTSTTNASDNDRRTLRIEEGGNYSRTFVSGEGTFTEEGTWSNDKDGNTITLRPAGAERGTTYDCTIEDLILTLLYSDSIENYWFREVYRKQ